MTYWEVPGDLDYDPDAPDAEPEVCVVSEPWMRGTQEVQIRLPKCRPMALYVSPSNGRLILMRREVDGSDAIVFDNLRVEA